MNSNELYHHGILGQKWGVRRYQNADGSLTNAGRKRQAKLEAKSEKYAQKSEYFRAKAGSKKTEDASKSNDQQNQNSNQQQNQNANQQQKKNHIDSRGLYGKKASEMTDTELQNVLNRMSNEARYKEATMTPAERRQRQMKAAASNAFKAVGSQLMRQVENKIAASLTEKLFGSGSNQQQTNNNNNSNSNGNGKPNPWPSVNKKGPVANPPTSRTPEPYGYKYEKTEKLLPSVINGTKSAYKAATSSTTKRVLENYANKYGYDPKETAKSYAVSIAKDMFSKEKSFTDHSSASPNYLPAVSKQLPAVKSKKINDYDDNIIEGFFIEDLKKK